MELRISNALRQIGVKFDFDLSAELVPVPYSGRTICFSRPVVLKGIYFYNGKELNVDGVLNTSFHSVCARCGEPFIEKFQGSFHEVFLNSALVQTDNQDSYYFSGETVDLEKAIMDNILLQIPMVSYCREDCKGVCPVCGTNLNYQDCSCRKNGKSGAFDVLQNFIFENNE